MRTYYAAILLGAFLIAGLGLAPLAPWSSSTDDPDESPTLPETESSEDSPTTDSFGLPASQYEIKDYQVGPHETFSDLLAGHGIAYRDILRIAEQTSSTFDTRSIRRGDSYRIYYNEWLQQAQYLIYERSPTRYVVLDLLNPEASHTGEQSPSVSWETAGGTIDNSFYQTVVNDGGHPDLVLEMADVFAWQVDFFRVQRGDSFQILYEERHLGDDRLSPGDIVAARFTHRGEDYYAFRFDEGSRSNYFDLDGNSLRRELLQAPLEYSRITSGFTESRYHPILDEYRPHHGTDYAASTGTPVRAVGDGTVEQAGYYGNNGNYVKIRHNSTYTTGYLHLSRIEGGVSPGAEVEQGDVIGYVGSTGLATGPHLCYRLWKNEEPKDPYELELPPSHPVHPKHAQAYDNLVRTLKPYVNGTSASLAQQTVETNDLLGGP